MSNPDTNEKALTGVVGFFNNAESLMTATRSVRDSAKYSHFDVFTPYPIHGMNEAQGLKRSPLPYVTFVAGLTGGSLGFLLQYWTSGTDWPLIVGGKPYNSWPAFIPVTFELTVLLAALSTVGAMFALNGLPNVRRRAFDPNITRDRFALMIESPPVKDEDDEDPNAVKAPSFNEAEAKEFLTRLGAKDVKSVFAEGWF